MNLDDVNTGDSIAINGVCLTTLEAHTLIFDLGPETLACSSLRNLESGKPVHLEKAMRLSDRLGGHLVQGHVDGVGKLVDRKPNGDSLELTFHTTPEIIRLCIPKGSITIDGVSLTINQIENQTFSVCIVPHTLQQTLLSTLKLGDPVNLENDLIGKYVFSYALTKT